MSKRHPQVRLKDRCPVSSKACYRTENGAKAAIHRLLTGRAVDPKNDHRLEPYFHRLCQSWHIGHRRERPMTNSTQQLVTTQQDSRRYLDRFTEEERELLRTTVAKGCTDAEITYGLAVGEALGLSLFAKQYYLMKFGQGANARLTLVVGVDGYRAIAGRSPNYAGSEPAVIGPMVEDRRVEGGLRPEYVDVTVWRRYGPLPAQKDKSTFRAYWEHHYNRNNGQRWAEDPKGMLAKCAEVGALKQAFSGSTVWDKVAAVDEQPFVIEGEATLVDPLDTGIPLPTVPSATPPPTPGPQLDPDLLGLLHQCPVHGEAWNKGEYGLYHRTPETKIATTGKNKGKEVPVTCNAKTVMPRLLVEESERCSLDAAAAATILDSQYPGKRAADLTAEQAVNLMQTFREYAKVVPQGDEPTNPADEPPLVIPEQPEAALLPPDDDDALLAALNEATNE